METNLLVQRTNPIKVIASNKFSIVVIQLRVEIIIWSFYSHLDSMYSCTNIRIYRWPLNPFTLRTQSK